MPASPRDGGWWAEAGSPPSQAAETAREKSLQAGRGPIPGVRPHPPGPVPERAGVCLQEPSLFLTSGPRCWVRAARPPAPPGSKPCQRGPSKLCVCGCGGGGSSPVGTGLGSRGAPSGPGTAPPVRKVMEAVGGRFPPCPHACSQASAWLLGVPSGVRCGGCQLCSSGISGWHAEG